MYDTYLKNNWVETIDIKKKNFKIFFFDFLTLFIFWIEYFKKNNIKAIIGSHPVYTMAIPLRIAAQKNIPSYVIDLVQFHKVTKNNLTELSDRKNYRKIAKTLKDIKKGKKIAKKMIEAKLNSAKNYNDENPQISGNSFHARLNKSVIKKSNRIKILVSSHEFFDAVNVYGGSFFSDFYEWMEYLGKLSLETSYDWYIKVHPVQKGKYALYQPFTTKVLDRFVKKYKKFKILPLDYSHKQILKEKIDFALTVFGSIAYEYPHANIPVITASLNHPTSVYKFSTTPKSKKHYDYLLRNLHKFKHKINKEEIYEYYYLRFIYNKSASWLVDYSKAMKKFKYFSNFYSNEFYDFYMKDFNKDNYKKKVQVYTNFINSKNYRIKELDFI